MTYPLTETDTGFRVADDDRDYVLEAALREIDEDREERLYGPDSY
jgi:hypothetical protein